MFTKFFTNPCTGSRQVVLNFGWVIGGLYIRWSTKLAPSLFTLSVTAVQFTSVGSEDIEQLTLVER
jgi:hypothetical protein